MPAPFDFSHDTPTVFLIEEGQANDGDLGVAREMIELTAEAGADAIEFQVADADRLYVTEHPQHTKYRRREFASEQLAELAQIAHSLGLAITGVALSDRLP